MSWSSADCLQQLRALGSTRSDGSSQGAGDESVPVTIGLANKTASDVSVPVSIWSGSVRRRVQIDHLELVANNGKSTLSVRCFIGACAKMHWWAAEDPAPTGSG